MTCAIIGSIVLTVKCWVYMLFMYSGVYIKFAKSTANFNYCIHCLIVSYDRAGDVCLFLQQDRQMSLWGSDSNLFISTKSLLRFRPCQLIVLSVCSHRCEACCHHVWHWGSVSKSDTDSAVVSSLLTLMKPTDAEKPAGISCLIDFWMSFVHVSGISSRVSDNDTLSCISYWQCNNHSR